MDAKLSVTTRCNAMCKTCPVWSIPGDDSPFDTFKAIYDRLNESHRIDRILLNNTGDLYIHPEAERILKCVEENKKKYVCMTTNAAALDYVPAIDHLVISFNGGTKESYEFTTGLDFDEVSANIRAHFEDFKRVKTLEMHCLAWEATNGSEADIVKTWADFPGRIRVSYKYDNQQEKDFTIDKYKRETRIPCDYLDILSIWPNGDVVQCAHDFNGENRLGNVLEDLPDDLFFNLNRVAKKNEHSNGDFKGICEKCNYNTPNFERIFYVK